MTNCTCPTYSFSAICSWNTTQHRRSKKAKLAMLQFSGQICFRAFAESPHNSQKLVWPFHRKTKNINQLLGVLRVFVTSLKHLSLRKK